MSVENINPYNKYQGNGVATEFSVDFPYNNKTDVVVYLKNEGEAQQTLVVNTDYTWLNDTTIKTTTAPADGSILAIYRETPAASDYNFENQRRLFPEEVTNSDNLAILLIQELKAMFSRTLTVDETSTVTPEELVDELNSLVTTAAGYVSQCSGYSDLAKDWATKTDGPVSGGEYSSKYYAEQIIPMASDIASVVGNATNINTVASNISDINSCVSNMPAIQDAPNQAQAAADSAALSAQYANDKINQTHISNCITEIPQDIILELNNGTLTLKAGSKVYVPNGVGVFDTITTSVDLSLAPVGSYTGYDFLYVRNNSSQIDHGIVSEAISGATAPAGTGFWYDTTNNLIKFYSSGSDTGVRVSFPIAIIHRTNGVWDDITQVFNGFGYVGHHAYKLPNVKGLVAYGRNEDETLKSFTVGSSDIQLYELPNNRTDTYMYISRANVFLMGSRTSDGYPKYDASKNWCYCNSTSTDSFLPVVKFATNSSNQVTLFEIKTPFHAVDYNDTEFIGHQSMPSNRKVNLTLGASGSSYTAPADGYFCLSKQSTGTQWANLINSNTDIRIFSTSQNGDSVYLFIPARKGDVIFSFYTLAGTTEFFIFSYAEGSK